MQCKNEGAKPSALLRAFSLRCNLNHRLFLENYYVLKITIKPRILRPLLMVTTIESDNVENIEYDVSEFEGDRG